MSRGLSQRQLRVLGLAVTVSRLRNGAPVTYVPRLHPDWRVPVVTEGWADLTTPLAAHVLGGVGLRPKYGGSTVYLETTPAALNARSASSRAITSLMKRGLLAYRPRDMPGSRDVAGYVLTARGLAAGLPYELVVPDLERRLWLLRVSFPKEEEHRDWQLYDFLPSPVYELRSNISADAPER